MAKRSNELLPGTLDLLVLKTLSLGALHGYGIAQLIRTQSDDALLIEEGSLYPALQRLERKGFIKSDWKVSPTNRRARFYQLTAAGKKQLRAEQSEFENMVAAIFRVIRTA